jgi:hypothetical protein
MLDLNSETLTLLMHGIIVIFRIKLNGFWDFYHGTNVGLGFRPGTEWNMHFVVHWRWLFVWQRAASNPRYYRRWSLAPHYPLVTLTPAAITTDTRLSADQVSVSQLLNHETSTQTALLPCLPLLRPPTST